MILIASGAKRQALNSSLVRNAFRLSYWDSWSIQCGGYASFPGSVETLRTLSLPIFPLCEFGRYPSGLEHGCISTYCLKARDNGWFIISVSWRPLSTVWNIQDAAEKRAVIKLIYSNTVLTQTQCLNWLVVFNHPFLCRTLYLIYTTFRE
jgi:hypothetical protein